MRVRLTGKDRIGYWGMWGWLAGMGVGWGLGGWLGTVVGEWLVGGGGG